MAIISINQQRSEVKALGSAMHATMNLSGAMFDMLATVYKYMLMAAIREPIQNGVDAVKRLGMSAADGVMVYLPTLDNPVIKVVDKGAGMTKAFMEADDGYLSFGSSTKAADNGAAGGLGVGRWAAYGYIRECYIVTCNAEDMIERTYFQFQGKDGRPQVQLASEVPGTVTGTQVYFPVKDADLPEALRAVSWLREVMTLTMGDAFSVDSPSALSPVLPDFSGVRLDLEEVDPSLAGVRIFPMHGTALQYGRQGLQDGSLVVLTNQESGVGGLPFHVQSPTDWQSVFFRGMIIEIPMSFNLPFMPSREELKYSDEVYALLRKIDHAAKLHVIKTARELYAQPDLSSKATLSNLLGNDEVWHWFARGTRDNKSALYEPLIQATSKNSPWTGLLAVPFERSQHLNGVQLKFTKSSDPVLREAYSVKGRLHCNGKTMSSEEVSFKANKPIRLVCNDLATGGTARFRSWLKSQREGLSFLSFVYVTAEEIADAKTTVEGLNAAYGGALPVHLTSSFPDVSRKVVGGKVVARTSRVGQITFHSFAQGKQVSEEINFDTYRAREPQRVWIRKDGGKLEGFKDDVTLADLLVSYGGGDLRAVATKMGIDKLYLLTSKQVDALAKAQADAQAEGLFDLALDEFDEEAGGHEAYHAVCALKGWVAFEDALMVLMDTSDIQDVLNGKRVRSIDDCYDLRNLCNVLAKEPRMMLTGTKFDKAIAPYLDVVAGKTKYLDGSYINKQPLNHACNGLNMIAAHMVVSEFDSDDRKSMIQAMHNLASAGHLDYKVVWRNLVEQFPLLGAVGQLGGTDLRTKLAIEHFCHALAALYK
ncbi:cell division protein [Novimethylophilus kurashikiensis]|uniref:Cell division protein n=1 Tax=Novimethylophilus kurashikiensis TaxID=1825523 RepID=A0A2R5F9Z3_9PROT|nr:ATP-binding protein [Novimethylophilus kurashikiensis]GBG14368.1 cell division protein [Novimethylophilus kurashikiensis]